jgi:N-acetylglucosaminyl-diphospho-decaprenol L-rhamnosyltransferase
MTTPAPPAPSVAVVIVTFESAETLGACLDSLRRYVGIPYEIAVVDNASTDGSATLARDHPAGARVIENPANLGFAAACNQGLRGTSASHVLFLNPDAEVTAGALEVLVAALDSRPSVGAVGPRTCHDDGTIQVSTGPDLTLMTEMRQRRLVRGVRDREPRAVLEASARHATEHEPAWVSGACLMARREALEAVGGFDEEFFLYEEDADLCRRLREAGWRVLFTPAAEIRHRLGRSMARTPERSRLEYHRSHLRYYRKHNGLLARGALRALLAGRGIAGLVRGALAGTPADRAWAYRVLAMALGRD